MNLQIWQKKIISDILGDKIICFPSTKMIQIFLTSSDVEKLTITRSVGFPKAFIPLFVLRKRGNFFLVYKLCMRRKSGRVVRKNGNLCPQFYLSTTVIVYVDDTEI